MLPCPTERDHAPSPLPAAPALKGFSLPFPRSTLKYGSLRRTDPLPVHASVRPLPFPVSWHTGHISLLLPILRCIHHLQSRPRCLLPVPHPARCLDVLQRLQPCPDPFAQVSCTARAVPPSPVHMPCATVPSPALSPRGRSLSFPPSPYTHGTAAHGLLQFLPTPHFLCISFRSSALCFKIALGNLVRGGITFINKYGTC